MSANILRTQNQQILAHLRSGRPLTPLEALDLYGCARLAARIYDLKRAGHRSIRSAQGTTSGGKRYASYYLPAEPVQIDLRGWAYEHGVAFDGSSEFEFEGGEDDGDRTQ